MNEKKSLKTLILSDLKLQGFHFQGICVMGAWVIILLEDVLIGLSMIIPFFYDLELLISYFFLSSDYLY